MSELDSITPIKDLDFDAVVMYALLNCIRPPQSSDTSDYILKKSAAVEDLETLLYDDLPKDWEKRINEEVKKELGGKVSGDMLRFLIAQKKLRHLVRIIKARIPKNEDFEM